MGKKKSIFIAIKWVAVLLPSMFCAFKAVAQTSLPDRLAHVLETQDMVMGIKLYNEIAEADLEQLPDSVLFDYHYLGGYINSEIPNHDKAIAHLLEAKRLCDTSLGVHSTSYQEIMYALGNEYNELSQFEEALALYQEGIVKTMYIRNNNTHGFGNLIIGVQDCYENLGAFNEIPILLKDAWIYWPKNEMSLVLYSYFPLWRLESFYKRYGMYENALSVSGRIEAFIKSKGGENHSELAEALYMKGNILIEMNRPDDGIKAFQKALEILNANGSDNSELFGLVAGTLFMALISTERFEESDKVLNRIKNYSISNNTPTYKNALYSAANRVADMCNYTKSITYNSILLDYNITDEERDIIENQNKTILYNQEVVESLPVLENAFVSLQRGQDNWFETGHKLSSAYYLVKNYEKNQSVLTEMYQAIDLNKSIGTDYYLWVLNNLYRLSLDTEKLPAALGYAAEKWNYISQLTDIPESYRYSALNDLVVAKIKSNILKNIDNNLDLIEKFYRAEYGDNSLEYATYLHNRGRAYQLQAKLDEAKETLLQSITLQNKLEGKPLERTVKYYMEVEQQMGEL